VRPRASWTRYSSNVNAGKGWQAHVLPAHGPLITSVYRKSDAVAGPGGRTERRALSRVRCVSVVRAGAEEGTRVREWLPVSKEMGVSGVFVSRVLWDCSRRQHLGERCHLRDYRDLRPTAKNVGLPNCWTSDLTIVSGLLGYGLPLDFCLLVHLLFRESFSGPGLSARCVGATLYLRPVGDRLSGRLSAV
jgi:hypothetical protein